MHKVKIIFIETICGDYDSYYEKEICRDSTDWADVNDETLQYLKSNLHRMYPNKYNMTPRLVIADTTPIEERVKQIDKAIAELKARDEAEKAKREAKRLQKAKTKLEQKKAALKKLQAELQEAGVRI